MLPTPWKMLCQLLMVLLLIHAHSSKTSPLAMVALPWDSSSFLLVTGLSRAALQELSTMLLVNNNQQPILPRCRPELLDCTAQLSLYLFFIGSTMGSKQLYLIFGLVLSVCSDVVNKITGLLFSQG